MFSLWVAGIHVTDYGLQKLVQDPGGYSLVDASHLCGDPLEGSSGHSNADPRSDGQWLAPMHGSV